MQPESFIHRGNRIGSSGWAQIREDKQPAVTDVQSPGLDRWDEPPLSPAPTLTGYLYRVCK
jgi:hypothetical protein